uniref:Putative ovule protein n=1 Tax=Solanum chacoense TaxID=4108 RepID=A0A0V0HEA0_SOLCH
MEARCLSFTVHSASDLINVRKIGKMKVYAKVSIAGKSKCTEPDVVNNINPEWNKKLEFMVPEIQAQGKISVKIELFCKRSLSPDKYVGEVNLSLDSQCLKSCNTCSVDRSDSNYESSSFGTLMYSSVLGEKDTVVDSPPSKPPSKDYTNKIGIAQIGATLVGAVAAVGAALVDD